MQWHNVIYLVLAQNNELTHLLRLGIMHELHQQSRSISGMQMDLTATPFSRSKATGAIGNRNKVIRPRIPLQTLFEIRGGKAHLEAQKRHPCFPPDFHSQEVASSIQGELREL